MLIKHCGANSQQDCTPYAAAKPAKLDKITLCNFSKHLQRMKWTSDCAASQCSGAICMYIHLVICIHLGHHSMQMRLTGEKKLLASSESW